MLSTRSGGAPAMRGRRSLHSARASSIQWSAPLISPAACAPTPSPPHTATIITHRSTPSSTSRHRATSPRDAPGTRHDSIPSENAAAISTPLSRLPRHPAPPSPSPIPSTSTHRPSHLHGASPITSRRPGAFTVARSATASPRRDHSRTRVHADGAEDGDGSASRSNSTRAYEPSGA